MTENQSTLVKPIKFKPKMVKNETFKFNHSSEIFNEALGVSEETNNYCMEVVFFSTISNYLLRMELFGDDDENSPKSLTTVTGDLEKALRYATHSLLRDYILLIFRNFHDIAIDSIAKYNVITQSSSLQKKKIMLMMEMAEVKMTETEEKHNESNTFVKPSDMMKRISFVKKAKYDFHKYLELMHSYQNSNDHITDINITDDAE